MEGDISHQLHANSMGGKHKKGRLLHCLTDGGTEWLAEGSKNTLSDALESSSRWTMQELW